MMAARFSRIAAPRSLTEHKLRRILPVPRKSFERCRCNMFAAFKTLFARTRLQLHYRSAPEQTAMPVPVLRNSQVPRVSVNRCFNKLSIERIIVSCAGDKIYSDIHCKIKLETFLSTFIINLTTIYLGEKYCSFSDLLRQ